MADASTIIQEIAAILAEAPVDVGAGDLTAFGALQTQVDAARERLEAPDAAALDTPRTDDEEGSPLGARLRAILADLSKLCEDIILGEVETTPETLPLVFEPTTALATCTDPASLQRALAQSAATLKAFRPETTETLRRDATLDEPPPPFGTVALAAPEDAVIYEEFILESNEHLERIEAGVLALESQGVSSELVDDMFRCFHSMKGAAGFMGLTAINRLCHETETLLDRLRKGTLGMSGDFVEVVLAAIDAAKRLLFSLEERLAAVKGGETYAGEELDIRPLLVALRSVAEAGPPAVLDGAEPGRIGGALVAEGAITEDQLAQALREQKKPVGQILVSMGATTPEMVEEAAQRAGAGRKTKGATSIKVDTTRLDALMEMVGELVIAQSQVAAHEVMREDRYIDLAKVVTNLSKIVDGLQEQVMAIRLVPLRQTFQRMHRLVRDTARKTAKEARLELSGEDTEIDKTVIEELADPLVHLLRNAVDHGLEPPAEREAAGKPREGRIDLMAYHEGGNVVIDIRDDGRGLNRDRIRQKAEERGLIAPGAHLDEQQIDELIFLPGFSTHDAATDISGRGVGMDVVKRNIETLGGRVEIASQPGAGSVFTIRLPLTMAIVDGMIVRVGRERFVVPTLGIEESIRPAPGQVSTVTGRGEMLMVRGTLIPVVRLRGLFAIPDATEDIHQALVLVVSDEERRSGLVVDELLGQQQVVIKSLGSHLQGITGISGASILGDGRVGLILDVPGLINLAQDR